MELMLGGLGIGGGGGLSTILGVAQAGLQLVGGMQQAAQAEAIGEWNARNAEERAKEERIQGAIEAARLRRQDRSRSAQQFAAFSSTGGASGTAYDVMDASAVNAELDALTLEYNGDRRGAALEAQAATTRYESQALASQYRTGAFGGALGTVATLDPLNFDSGSQSYWTQVRQMGVRR